MVLWEAACRGRRPGRQLDKTVCEANRVEYRAAEGEGPVAVCAWSVGWLFPSSAGLVEPRVNQPGPSGKPKYSCPTDSVLVP